MTARGRLFSASALGVALASAGASARAQTPAELRGFDIVALDYTAVLDPESAAASGALAMTLRVATVEAPAQLDLIMDAGLTITAVDADGFTVTAETRQAEPLHVVALTMIADGAAPAVGDELVVHVAYDGVLVCAPDDLRGHRACSFGPPLGHLRRESVLPSVFDPADGAATYELYRRSLALTLPEGLAAVGSGDAGETATDAGATTRTWASDVVHQVQDLVVVFGALDALDVPSAGPDDVPLRLWFAAGDDDWTREQVEWAAAAMPYLEALAGSPLPFDQVALVELPVIAGFPGTATANMVLLSEAYGDQLGPGYYEQTLAHELSHLWWGNVAYADEQGYWLLEGLARQAELGYMAMRYPFAEPGFAPDDGSGRSRWHAALMRYVLADDGLVPLVLPGLAQPPSSDVRQFTTWAYARGAATLDHLRAVVGPEAYAVGLGRWAADCAFVRCTSDDFRTFMEEASGHDLDALFRQHVFGTTFPEVTWTFTQAARAAGGVDVTVAFTQAPANATSELELWLEHADGSRDTQRVALRGASGALVLPSAAPVVRVAPNPYHDPIVWSRSGVDGDVDFDGAVDGVDLVACMQYVALGFPPVQDAATLFDVTPIDFRCDFDVDGTIDRADLELLALAFGTLEPGAADGGAP